MTWALCFHCGARKFGAICPCPECGAATTGDINLDITFSDHHISVETIEAFGKVVQAIRQVCVDDELCFWSFIRYAAVHHSDILGVDMPPDRQAKCDAVLEDANPPAVIVDESAEAKWRKEYSESMDNETE